jgi:antitoxin Xre/MbcA/ParS-like protein
MTTTARQFWDLMERWNVPGSVALELIGFAGKIGKFGKRPRFRFLPAHQQAADFKIDTALASAGAGVDWLHTKMRVLGGRTPIEQMRAEGATGMEKVLQMVLRSALRSSLKPQ